MPDKLHVELKARNLDGNLVASRYVFCEDIEQAKRELQEFKTYIESWCNQSPLTFSAVHVYTLDQFIKSVMEPQP